MRPTGKTKGSRIAECCAAPRPWAMSSAHTIRPRIFAQKARAGGSPSPYPDRECGAALAGLAFVSAPASTIGLGLGPRVKSVGRQGELQYPKFAASEDAAQRLVLHDTWSKHSLEYGWASPPASVASQSERARRSALARPGAAEASNRRARRRGSSNPAEASAPGSLDEEFADKVYSLPRAHASTEA